MYVYHLLIGIIVVADACAFAQSDPCESLLPQNGAYKITLKDGTTHTYNNAKAWFCSSDFSTYASEQKTSAGLNVVIPGINLGIGGNYDGSNSDSVQKRQTFCQDTNSTFTKDQEQFLLEKEGDPTLVSGFVQCENNRNLSKGFLKVSTDSHSAGIFEVDVSSQGFPDGHPLIVDVKPVTGATPILTSSLAPGTEIPMVGSGKTPLVGSYSFASNSSEAAILVQTTIGDQIVYAKRCPTGTAGHYQVREDVAHPEVVRIGDYTHDFSVNQASCHPHCCNDCGDAVSLTLSVDQAITLRNPRVICSPDASRPECQLNPMNAKPLNDHQIQIDGKTRTVGLPYRVYAEQYTTQPKVTRDVISEADVPYGQQFSIVLPGNDSGDLAITGAFGSTIFTEQMLEAGTLPPWLVQQAPPQHGTSTTVFTLEIKSPSCAD
jgi:hypothetical protein